MEVNFSDKLKSLRESLRTVGDKIKPNSNFFTYLSKIEAGLATPSKKFLYEIKAKYGLTEEEFEDLITSYLAVEIKKEWPEMKDKEKMMGELFRKIKNNKISGNED